MKTVIRKNDVNYPQDRIPSSFDSENVAYGDTNVKEKLDEISSKLLHYQDYNLTYSLNANELKMMKIDNNFAHTPISIIAQSDMQCLLGSPAINGSLLYTRIFSTYALSERSITIRVYYID